MNELFATRVGDDRTEDGRALLTERSPLTYAIRSNGRCSSARAPTIPRVKQAESDQIVTAMQRKTFPSPTCCSPTRVTASLGRRIGLHSTLRQKPS